MIRINQINIPIFEKDQEEAVIRKAAEILRIPEDGFRKLKIVKRSIDAREKNDIRFSYTVDAKLRDTFTGPNARTEKQYIDRLHNRNLQQIESIPVSIPDASEKAQKKRPVIVGSGPCGLFAALSMVSAGMKPVIVERGDEASERKRQCELLFESGRLNTRSNIQFGEGGAGLFSDGKLNTSIKGRENYIRFVLETFVEFGAPEDILIDAKPHIGTDVLMDVIVAMRAFIEENGGTYYFNTTFTGFETENGQVTKALFDGKITELPTDTILLCQGHSARDTYEMLKEKGVSLQKKAFAMGIRIQHPQELIDRSLYGEDNLSEKEEVLGPASYKLTHSCENGRSVFSFCMCPGGYVINSSSEEGRLCVNGMSYHDRASGVANAALIVNITPEDFPEEDVLSGIRLQREIEEKAYSLRGGMIPYETFGEFEASEENPLGDGDFPPAFLGLSAPAPVSTVLPSFMKEAITEGVHAFGRQIKGYDREGCFIAGVEARTSSPVRIPRDESFETSIRGLYAAGEGAGYAGGITSAAIDGIKAARALIEKFNEEK